MKSFCMLLLNRRGNSGGTRLPLHLGRCQNGWHAHKRVNIAVGGEDRGDGEGGGKEKEGVIKGCRCSHHP